jgi:hypothetical protein
MEGELRSGGCLCGATRYEVSGSATNLCWCHCRSCRLASGAACVAWGTFPARGFRVTRGELARYRSSAHVLRGFCPRCGTSLTYLHDRRPDDLDVTLASLDDPAALRPACHIWVSHALPWAAPGDGLPRHAEWRTPDAGEPS